MTCWHWKSSNLCVYVYIYSWPYGGFRKWGYPEIIYFNRIHYKPSIYIYGSPVGLVFRVLTSRGRGNWCWRSLKPAMAASRPSRLWSRRKWIFFCPILSMNMGLYSSHLNGTNRISWDSMGLKGLNKGFCLCSHDLAYGFSWDLRGIIFGDLTT